MLFFPAAALRHVLRDIAGLPGEDQLNCEILQAASGLTPPHHTIPSRIPLHPFTPYGFAFPSLRLSPHHPHHPQPQLSAFHSAEITQVPRLMNLSLPACPPSLTTLPSPFNASYLRGNSESHAIHTHTHLEVIPCTLHTSADATSGRAGNAGSEVALEPLGVVAGFGQAAVLVQLPGANFAAAAAVQHHADAGGALGHLQRTLAHGGAGGGGGGDGGDRGGEDLHSPTTVMLWRDREPRKQRAITQLRVCFKGK